MAQYALNPFWSWGLRVADGEAAGNETTVGGDSDAALLAGLRAGDPTAQRVLVDRHARTLYALAYSLVGNAADAEDVVQETFLGAIRRIDAFEGRASLKTWLSRILVNQASKLRRSRAIRRMAPLDVTGAGHDAPNEVAPPATPDNATPAARVEQRADVNAMLDALSPDHREVIVLRELQGLSYEEIAAALGVPRGTVESRLHRARNELRRRFSEYLS